MDLSPIIQWINYKTSRYSAFKWLIDDISFVEKIQLNNILYGRFVVIIHGSVNEISMHPYDIFIYNFYDSCNQLRLMS